jgi:hypothetical protein
METMKSTWTDERMDDLARRMDSGFERVHAEFRALRTELHSEVGGLRGELHSEVGWLRGELHSEVGGLRGELHSEVGTLRGEMNARFERVDARFDSMQRTMFGMMATIVVGFLVTNL